MEFRIGINVGDVIVEGERLYGDGVNIAARVEGLAEPGGICISGTVHDQVENKLALSYEYVGEQVVKNIAKPVRVWQVEVRESGVHSPVSKGEGQKDRRVGTAHRSWAVVTVAGLVLVVGTIVAVRHFARPPLSTQHSALKPRQRRCPCPTSPPSRYSLSPT